jgi:CRISPR-associated protein Cmr5
MTTLSIKKPVQGPAPTLEQQRAQFAWKNCSLASEILRKQFKDFTNVSKAAPALIMNNGLMQTLAYYQDKGSNDRGEAKPGQEHQLVLADMLRRWVGPRVFNIGSETADPGFKAVMEKLLQAGPADYRRATDETLLILRWIRQFAAAL